MFKKILISAAAICLVGAAQAQSEPDAEALELAQTLVEVTGTGEIIALQMTLAMKAAIGPQVPAMLKADPRSSGAEITDADVTAYFDAMQAHVSDEADSLIAQISPIWAENLSKDDMKSLIAFYESPLGRRLVAKLPALSAAGASAGESWGRTIGPQLVPATTERYFAQKAGN